MAYFQPDKGIFFTTQDVRVRIGIKATTAPRPLCYCFGHTAEDIEDQVEHAGTSSIPAAIADQCRQGLARCEETNPQGACCLGDVRRAVQNAQEKLRRDASLPAASAVAERPTNCAATPLKPRQVHASGGVLAQIGAIVTAAASSACCWLPLLLLAFGVSGGAVAATFEAWRPVLLPVTFLLLGFAFYKTYRGPKVALTTGVTGEAATETAAACCPPTARSTLKKFSVVMLWVVTAVVLAFTFFPAAVSKLMADRTPPAAKADLDRVFLSVDGMTCSACAATIEHALLRVPGVLTAEVQSDTGEAVLGITQGTTVSEAEISTAVAKAGRYTATFAQLVTWRLTIDGMSCERCAARLHTRLMREPGVMRATVNAGLREAAVVVRSSVTEGTLRHLVSDAGYTLTSATR